MEADAEIWDTLKLTTSKDDWALGALMAVFGADSKLYRARKPRSKDMTLRVFPSHPPVVLVLTR